MLSPATSIQSSSCIKIGSLQHMPAVFVFKQIILLPLTEKACLRGGRFACCCLVCTDVACFPEQCIRLW